jgi:glycosyltransferase involved in cell wall biosynthesis
MKIWIDGYEANVLQRLGSSQVAFKLLLSLEKEDHKNDYTILLPAPPLEDLPKERAGWKYKILKPKRLWTKIALPLALFTSKEKPDIFFSPTHYIPRFAPSRIKRVVTVFDLSFLRFPEMFTKKDLWQLKNWTKFSVENCDHIITISKCSKEDIVKSYGFNADKITVAYPGYDEEKFKLKDKGQQNLKDNYLIYIGTLQPRKNLVRLMEAFARVVKDVKDLKLVIVGKTTGEGKQGWMYDEILKTPAELGIQEKVKFVGYVPTNGLSDLLSGAVAFIQPSLWEGFGIPVVEAMASGTPVIVSNVSSLPEVVGKAGLLVDPYSIDQIEQAIRTIVSDKKLQQKYSKEGIIQAKKFSWDKMAKEVLEVFEKL